MVRDAPVLTRWDEGIRQDRRLIGSQAEAMSAALSAGLPKKNRWVVLSWAVRELWPAVELHLRKEKEALFPKMRRFLGKEAGAITLMEESHAKLRTSTRHLAELVQDQDNLDWDRIPLAVQGFLYTLEEHEDMEDRLLIRVLETHLTSEELEGFSVAFHRVGKKAQEEEGWPAPEHQSAERAT